MIYQATGMSGNCPICLTAFTTDEIVYVHGNELLHPSHPGCLAGWEGRCISELKPFDCPVCRQVYEVAEPIFNSQSSGSSSDVDEDELRAMALRMYLEEWNRTNMVYDTPRNSPREQTRSAEQEPVTNPPDRVDEELREQTRSAEQEPVTNPPNRGEEELREQTRSAEQEPVTNPLQVDELRNLRLRMYLGERDRREEPVFEIPAALRALRGVSIEPAYYYNNEPNVWDEARAINAYLDRFIVPENNTPPEREAINILRNYLKENIGVPDKDQEVCGVVRTFTTDTIKWPLWYALKLAAAKGNYDLVTALNPVDFYSYSQNTHWRYIKIPCIVAFEAFIANGWLDLAERLMPTIRAGQQNSGEYISSSFERGEALLFFAQTGLRRGARLVLQDGPVRYRGRAIKLALSHKHLAFALEIIFSPLRSRASITPL